MVAAFIGFVRVRTQYQEEIVKNEQVQWTYDYLYNTAKRIDAVTIVVPIEVDYRGFRFSHTYQEKGIIYLI
jgi:hypothetical protein